MATKPMHISEVYASQLQDLAQGYPLWFPEGPSDSDDIDIGDVGYIKEGQFIELFKAKYARDDPFNAKNLHRNRIPTMHQPLPEHAYSNILKTSRYMEPDVYTSKSMKRKELKPSVGAQVPAIAGAKLAYSLSAQEEKVAFLCIPHKAISETIENTRAFTRYMKQYHSAWVDHARNQVGLDIRSRGIIMVHGYVKTVEWIVAASRAGSVSYGGSLELEGGMNVVGSVAFDYAYEMSKNPSMQYRTGPEERLPSSRSPSPSISLLRDSPVNFPPGPESRFRSQSQSTLEVPLQPTLTRGSSPGQETRWNQCIFLRYFQVKWRIPGAYLHIAAGAGPHRLPRDPSPGEEADIVVSADDSRSGSDEEIESNVPTHTSYNSLDILLDYLLQHSDAEVAIACHGDIDTLLSGKIIPDFADFLEQSRPRVHVDEDQVATLDLVELVMNQRMRELTRKLATDLDTMDIDNTDDDTGGGAGRNEGAAIAYGGLSVGGTPSQTAPIRWPHIYLSSKDTEAGSITSAAISPDNKLLAAGCLNGTTELWHWETGQLAASFDGSFTDTVLPVAFSPDGNLLASRYKEGTILVRAAKDFAYSDATNTRIKLGDTLFELQDDDEDSDLTMVTFSPDGKWVAAGSEVSSARIWKVALDPDEAGASSPGSIITARTLGDPSQNIMQMAFAPDSKRIIASTDALLKVWDVETGDEVTTMDGHTGLIWCFAISHDGKRIISGSEDYTSRIWDTTSGVELVTIAEHAGPVWSVAWSPDDKHVVSCSYDATVIVSDSYTGERIHEFKEGSADVSRVVWMPFDDLICSGSNDGLIHLWSAKLGELVATFEGHSDRIKNLIPSRDGRDLVSLSDDGSIRIWNISDALRLF